MQKTSYFILMILSFMLSSCVAPAIIGGMAMGGAVVVSKDTTVSEYARDIKIAANIKKEFIAQGFKSLYTKIVINVTEGRVFLAGNLQTQEDVTRAIDIVWSISDVKDVINELEVNDNSSYFDTAAYSRDAWITARIKAKSMLYKEIKFVNYNVITVNSVVYILGIAKSQQSLDTLSQIASEVAGVKKVVTYAKVVE